MDGPGPLVNLEFSDLFLLHYFPNRRSGPDALHPGNQVWAVLGNAEVESGGRAQKGRYQRDIRKRKGSTTLAGNVITPLQAVFEPIEFSFKGGAMFPHRRGVNTFGISQLGTFSCKFEPVADNQI